MERCNFLCMDDIKLPRNRMFWAQTICIKTIANAMSGDIYFQLWNNLNVVDGNLGPQQAITDYGNRDYFCKIKKYHVLKF